MFGKGIADMQHYVIMQMVYNYQILEPVCIYVFTSTYGVGRFGRGDLQTPWQHAS